MIRATDNRSRPLLAPPKPKPNQAGPTKNCLAVRKHRAKQKAKA